MNPDWYTVQVVDLNPSSSVDDFQFHVQFDANPNSVHKIEVYSSCGSAILNPFDDFEFTLDGKPLVNDSQTFYIKVYIDPLDQPSCAGYTLKVSNGL